MSIAVYIRVSSLTQKHDSQQVEIAAWLKKHNCDPEKVQWFSDVDTGAHMTRSGIIALNESILAGNVKTIVIWKLDRIARNMRDGINTLSKWCEIGVRVVSVTQQIDLSGTVGHLVAGVLFAVAEMELQHMRERQAAGIAAAKAKGTYKGRKTGTTKGKPEQAKELKAQGLKSNEIAHALNVSVSTVQRYLQKNSS
ncbi:MAG: recombinase family protein [Holosporales bacterium]|jgi:DNA invertase Pin-like site-specific DNA recombinase